MKKIQIEARVLGDIALNHIVPTAVKYQTLLIENVKGLKEVFGKEFETLAKQHHSGCLFCKTYRWSQFVSLVMARLSGRNN